MILIKNYLLIFIIRFLNKFARGFVLSKKTFSSRAILERNYPKKSTFNFVQVGANDGVSFDFLYDFVINRKPKGILIEPVKDYFKELQQNYNGFDGLVLLNVAIHPFEKSLMINKISPDSIQKYPDWVKGIASLDVNHHLKTGIATADIVQEEVKADSLMNIINEYLVDKRLHYFQVDAEGFDYEVLKQLDFSSIKPLLIKFENVNLNEDEKKASMEILKANNYFLFNEFGDTIAVDLKKIKLFHDS
jgi:FkbM family methyltransferase